MLPSPTSKSSFRWIIKLRKKLRLVLTNSSADLNHLIFIIRKFSLFLKIASSKWRRHNLKQVNKIRRFLYELNLVIRFKGFDKSDLEHALSSFGRACSVFLNFCVSSIREDETTNYREATKLYNFLKLMFCEETNYSLRVVNIILASENLRKRLHHSLRNSLQDILMKIIVSDGNFFTKNGESFLKFLAVGRYYKQHFSGSENIIKDCLENLVLPPLKSIKKLLDPFVKKDKKPMRKQDVTPSYLFQRILPMQLAKSAMSELQHKKLDKDEINDVKVLLLKRKGGISRKTIQESKGVDSTIKAGLDEEAEIAQTDEEMEEDEVEKESYETIDEIMNGGGGGSWDAEEDENETNVLNDVNVCGKNEINDEEECHDDEAIEIPTSENITDLPDFMNLYDSDDEDIYDPGENIVGSLKKQNSDENDEKASNSSSDATVEMNIPDEVVEAKNVEEKKGGNKLVSSSSFDASTDVYNIESSSEDEIQEQSKKLLDGDGHSQDEEFNNKDKNEKSNTGEIRKNFEDQNNLVAPDDEEKSTKEESEADTQLLSKPYEEEEELIDITLDEKSCDESLPGPFDDENEITILETEKTDNNEIEVLKKQDKKLDSAETITKQSSEKEKEKSVNEFVEVDNDSKQEAVEMNKLKSKCVGSGNLESLTQHIEIRLTDVATSNVLSPKTRSPSRTPTKQSPAKTPIKEDKTITEAQSKVDEDDDTKSEVSTSSKRSSTPTKRRNRSGDQNLSLLTVVDSPAKRTRYSLRRDSESSSIAEVTPDSPFPGKDKRRKIKPRKSAPQSVGVIIELSDEDDASEAERKDPSFKIDETKDAEPPQRRSTRIADSAQQGTTRVTRQSARAKAQK